MRVIISRTITVDPASEAYQTIYTVSPGSRFRLERVKVYFPPGTASELQVKILQGWTSIAPTEGFFSGDSMEFSHEVHAEYGGESRVIAFLKNLNTASAKQCTITLEGEE